MKIVFAPLSLLFVLFANAQELTQTVKGQITDDQSGQVIIGATVLIANTSPPQGAITDAEGFYRIEEVPIGRQTIQVSYLGYESALFPGVLVGSGKEVILNVELTESLEQLEEVVVTSRSNTGLPINDMASVSAISISVEETSRFAATFDDPARAALTFAGVQTGGDDLLNEIVIRGNTPKGILWRLEGVEIQNPNHFGQIGSSAGGISMLSSNVLSNSDFFTSAFPAQYGNATSGVFDLNLRKGNFDKNETAFEVGLLGVGAALEGPLSKKSNASYLINYRYSTLALASNVGLDVLGEQEEVTFQDLSFKFFFPTKKFGSFSVWGLGGDNSYDFLPDRSVGETLYDEESQRMGVAGITNVFYLTDDSYLETVVSGSYQKIGDVEDSLRTLITFEEDFIESQFRVSTLYNHKLSPRTTIRGGLIFSRLGYDLISREYSGFRSTYDISIDEDGRSNFYQSYFNWQYRPSSKLTINSGLHLSSFALNNKTYLEPRFGFQYRTSFGLFTGGAGLHSRMETVALYTAQQQLEDGSMVQNNRDLGFTRAMHSVLGFQAPIGSSGYRFKTEIY
ncbi:MAG: carboxypeptidase-like regulatory domain-containing protein, partial [Bacteroidota bacterium]